MNSPVRYAIAAAAVLVVALIGLRFLPSNTVGPDTVPTLLPTASAAAATSSTPAPTAAARTTTLHPFRGDGGTCPGEADPGCAEDPRDDTIAFTFVKPPAWSLFEEGGLLVGDGPADAASVMFYRGSWLFSEPCLVDPEAVADVPVGPTVEDFVMALDAHPSLDVTTPVDVTLAGYAGTYVDLTVPDDISACASYRPIDGHIFAQGPGQRWHMWVLDVGGVRVLVETNDYAGTSSNRRAEIQAILDSLVITP